VAAIGLTGTFAVWYFQQGNPPKNQMAPAAPIHETRSAPSRTRDDSSVVAAPKPRSDIDGLALAKTPRPGASTLALRDPAIDEWLTAAYLHCWTQPGAPSGGDYAAQIRVTHNADGSLAAAPVLVNPPNDPAWRAFADSTVEAVTKCSPLRVPQKYIARYSQWKKVTLHFSPDNARE
jgi:hypothetical protein